MTVSYWTNSFCVVLFAFMCRGVNLSRSERHSSASRLVSRLNLIGGLGLDLFRAIEK